MLALNYSVSYSLCSDEAIKTVLHSLFVRLALCSKEVGKSKVARIASSDFRLSD